MAMVDIMINPPPVSRGQIGRTRALGNLMSQQGLQFQPIQHPLQGLGQLAQSAMGAYLMSKADRQEQERREQANQALLSLMAPQTASVEGSGAGLGSMPAATPSLAALMTTSSQFPELAPVINPMVQAQMAPSKPLVLGPGQVAYGAGGEEIARGPEAAPKFTTDYGKAMADVKLAEDLYGKDSDQAMAFREIAQAERAGGGEIDLSDEAGQRKEFTKASDDFVKVRDAFGKIQKARPTAAGDLAMIFNYRKLLDPGSVVREGEFATAQNTAGVPDRVRNQYNRLLTGERLNPEQRQNFKDQAGDVFIAQRDQQNLLEDEFSRIATASGLRPSNVIVDYQGPLRDFTVAAEEPAPTTPPAEIPRAGDLNIGGAGAAGGTVSDTDLVGADTSKMSIEELEAWNAEMNRRGL